MVAAVPRNFWPCWRRIRHKPLLRTSQYAKSTLAADVVANRDLYYSSEYVHSTKKIPYKGERPSLYPRFATEPPMDRSVHAVKNTRLLEVLEGRNNSLEARMKPRTEAVASLVGSKYHLATQECIAVLCGLSDVEVQLAQKKSLNTVSSISTPKLRQMGKSVFDLTKNTLFIFSNEQYLSSGSQEISATTRWLDDEKTVIPIFMKRNLIFDQLIPFRGTMRSRPLEVEEAVNAKEKIVKATAIGSFYTLLGLLVVKYGKNQVVEDFLVPRILNGQSGIANIITELSRTQRAT